MAREELGWATFFVFATGTVFAGIQALKVATARLVAKPEEILICPNCGQPFDASEFPLDKWDGKRYVTCPRCWLTYEA